MQDLSYFDVAMARDRDIANVEERIVAEQRGPSRFQRSRPGPRPSAP